MLGILAVCASASMMIAFRAADLRIGYYLWTASMFSFAVGSLVFFLRSKKQELNGPPSSGSRFPGNDPSRRGCVVVW